MSTNTQSKDDDAGVSPTDQDVDSERPNMDIHPWPYLASMFSFCSVSANTYRFKCVLCTPKMTECSAYHNSPSNLKKHIERMHPAHLQQYDMLAAGARKRKADASEEKA